LDEYYLTNAEIDVLTTWGSEMAKNIQSGTMVVELGSGSVFYIPETSQFRKDKANPDPEISGR
jgi:hypothetical protein